MNIQNAIAIDTETFYDKECSVQPLGAHAYTRHKDFEVLCVSGASRQDEGWCRVPETTQWDRIKGRPIIAHNVAFDRAVLRSMPQFHDLPNEQWFDSAALCAYHQYPRDLARASKEVLGVEHKKTVRTAMKGKRLEDLDDKEQEALFEYAVTDAVNCYRIFEKLYPITPSHEIKLSQLAVDQGERGICIDTKRLGSALSELEAEDERQMNLLPWFRDGYKAGSPIGLKKACEASGIEAPVSTAAKSKELEYWIERNKDKEPWIRALHTHRSIVRLISTLETIQTRVRPDNILEFGVKYFGAAATGRFSGDQGINLLNLNKNDVAGFCLRDIFVARPGHKFIIADLSQIEPRCLAWLTNDKVMLESMLAGQDLYEAHARATMGYQDPRPLKEVDDDLRQKAKVRVLSMGYGLGVERHAENMGISIDEAKTEVYEFRRSAHRTSGYWHSLNNYFEAAARGDGEFELELPSGRSQKYFDIRNQKRRGLDGQLRDSLYAATTKGDRLRYPWWGAKLCENVCQGVARDVFCHGLLDVVEKGINVPFTVYDELVAEVPEDQAEEALKEIVESMTKVPDWMPGLPLAVDAHIASYYDKR